MCFACTSVLLAYYTLPIKMGAYVFFFSLCVHPYVCYSLLKFVCPFICLLFTPSVCVSIHMSVINPFVKLVYICFDWCPYNCKHLSSWNIVSIIATVYSVLWLYEAAPDGAWYVLFLNWSYTMLKLDTLILHYELMIYIYAIRWFLLRIVETIVFPLDSRTIFYYFTLFLRF